MSAEFDFKDLWAKQPVNPLDIESLLLKIKNFKSRSLRRLLILNILLIATSAFLLFFWHSYQPQFIATKIGISLTILAMAIYALTYNKLFSSYQAIDNTQNNSQYLQNLISIRARQQFMQKTMLSFYFVMLSVGVCLGQYEYISRMTILREIFAWTITLVWFGFVWFYLRPRQIKKETEKVNEIITKFKTINSQLTDA